MYCTYTSLHQTIAFVIYHVRMVRIDLLFSPDLTSVQNLRIIDLD